MDLSTIGVFAFLDGLNGTQTGEPARKVEHLGYSVLWIPEGAGRDPFAHAGYLLGQNRKARRRFGDRQHFHAPAGHLDKGRTDIVRIV